MKHNHSDEFFVPMILMIGVAALLIIAVLAGYGDVAASR